MAVFSDEQRLQIFKDLIAIQSVNTDEEEVSVYLKNLFGRHGISATIIPVSDRRTDLTAEIGTGNPVLGVSGHMDVVSPGDASQWTSDPFTLTERDGKLYGRGAADMKSGLAAMVIAMIEIHDQGLLNKGRIRLMATMGEEVGELGSRTFAYNGSMKDVDALIIGEPSGYRIAYAHKGSMDIRLTSTGKAAHSSMPEQGYNAIDPLIDLLHNANHQFRTADKKNALLGDLSFNTTIFQGGDQVNSIPAEAVAELNIRTIPEFDNDVVDKQLGQLVQQQNTNGAKITKETYMSQPSVETTGDKRLIDLAQKIGKLYAEKDIPSGAIPAVTDASNLLRDKPKDFPFIIFGPGSDSVHQIDEFVDKQMYFNFIEIYQKLFTEYLA
ncbi:ArgE/DapE family deacylase [Lentilactobacillus parakefiri]|uniref:Probable succinyl-diaminopimelate desuccinylase n=1 Tax=Lentilactobacillus parakefiri TaxID=152332 RepID=A0A269YFL5_9LACO|nr:ArgE/DapE family deacylase [Lentilactobacillus parakefiri]PAK84343.1 succinyl-diaminopimelate desuccinylase [Lentilactobacillus parakefiri]